MVFFPNPGDPVTRGFFKSSTFDFTQFKDPQEMSAYPGVTKGIQPEMYQDEHSVIGHGMSRNNPRGQFGQWFKKTFKKGKDWFKNNWVDIGKHAFDIAGDLLTQNPEAKPTLGNEQNELNTNFSK